MSDDGLKVGDDIAFSGRRDGSWRIHKITKITPSGRMVCGPYTLNPNLTIRGRNLYGPVCGHIVTSEIRKQCRRQYLLGKIEQCKWNEIPDDQLLAVFNIISTGSEPCDEA